MPYYIYRVKPFAQLDKLAEHPAFGPASAQAKILRAELPAGSPDRIKVIFAENETQAEDLLCQIRDPLPPGEE